MLRGKAIQQLDKQQQHNEDAETVPKLPFSMLISAQKGGGKSTTLLNLLLNKDLLAGKFNQIYYISPTAILDSKTDMLRNTPGLIKVNRPLITLLNKRGKSKILDETFDDNANFNYDTKIPAENFIEEVAPQMLKDIIAEQKRVITKYGKKNADDILLVYDDCISAKKFWGSDSVLKMLLNSRHYKISVIITTQAYKLLPKSLRLNMSFVVLFYTANAKELQSIYEENSSSIGWKKFEKIFNETTEKPYNSLVINYQALPKHRLQSAFEKTIEI